MEKGKQVKRRVLIVCDRCNVEKEESEGGFCDIGIGVREEHYAQFSGATTAFSHQQTWCLDCLRKLGLKPKDRDTPKSQQVPAPTFEELLREIIREEIEASK